MSTLSLIEKRLNEISDKEVYPIKTGVYKLSFNIRFPFRTRYRMNEFFWFIGNNLQPNTNMVSFFDKELGEYIPYTYEMLESITELSHSNFGNYMTELRTAGIILTVAHPHRFKVMYMNPFFAFCGDNLNPFLIEMFRVNNLGAHVEGEHLFYPNGLFYRMNRNEDCMFGDYNHIKAGSILTNGESTSGRTSKNK